jgi:hypothetical protein
MGLTALVPWRAGREERGGNGGAGAKKGGLIASKDFDSKDDE